jgi:hypothetical protein
MRENPKKEIGTTTKNTSTVEPISDVLSAVSGTYGKNNNDALSRELIDLICRPFLASWLKV